MSQATATTRRAPRRTERRTVRCAIYTRKSTGEGLEQDFNSLDAQREAALSYIDSQRAQGWTALPDRFDDGGYSGGDTDRPALQRLLADVEARRLDVIVVYKVDRLSRSLLDFARLIGTFDEHGVSLVSVTQQLNTTSSMGRLTLNILLSFAQFEREMISERTRDKMHAARRRGKWTGGYPPLGYDVHPEGGRLVVNEDEAERVRAIYELYLEHRSLSATVKELRRRGWVKKRWVTRKGHVAGGSPFSKSCLSKMLANVIYLGKVKLKGTVYEGEHEPIVDGGLWTKAEEMRRRNGHNGGGRVRNKYGALLKGLIVCGSCDRAMTHTTSGTTKTYRYYVCAKAQADGWDTCPTKSVPAGEIERFVVDRIRCIGSDPRLLAETLRETGAQRRTGADRLESELAALRSELAGLDDEVRAAVREGRPGDEGDGPGTARLADLQDRIRVAERRKTEVEQGLRGLDRENVDADTVRRALADFDPVWEALPARDRVRLVHLLIERVGYDGEASTVAVTFRPSGIAALAEKNGFREED
ncbi:MAG: recombinase family protein [Planctomycetota bacterium]